MEIITKETSNNASTDIQSQIEELPLLINKFKNGNTHSRHKSFNKITSISENKIFEQRNKDSVILKEALRLVLIAILEKAKVRSQSSYSALKKVESLAQSKIFQQRNTDSNILRRALDILSSTKPKNSTIKKDAKRTKKWHKDKTAIEKQKKRPLSKLAKRLFRGELSKRRLGGGKARYGGGKFNPKIHTRAYRA